MKLFGSNNIAFLVCCLITILLMIGHNSDKISSNELKKTSASITAPIEKITSNTNYYLSNIFNNINSFFTGFEENKRLKERNFYLEQYYYLSQKLTSENQQLREELTFTKTFDHPYLTANIIARDNSANHQQITIDAGSKNGINKWQVVLFQNQLVGRVVEVYNQTSLVLLLNDQESRIPVITEDTKNKFIAAGISSDHLSCKYLNTHTELEPGELVITSGEELSILPNLIVGIIVKEQNDFYIKPTVDFDKMKLVHVVLQ